MSNIENRHISKLFICMYKFKRISVSEISALPNRMPIRMQFACCSELILINIILHKLRFSMRKENGNITRFPYVCIHSMVL